MKKPSTRLAYGLAAACLALPLAGRASDEAYAKMMECLKLPAASPQQEACLTQVKQMTAAAPKPKAAIARSAAAPTAPRSAAASPPASSAAKPSAPSPTAPPEVRQAAATLAVNGTNASGVAGVAAVNISGMDLESALMAVQSQRANLLESQLRDQMEAIKVRNAEIATLNKMITELRVLRPAGSNPDAWGNLGQDRKSGQEMLARLKAAGATMPTGADAVKDSGPQGIPAAKQRSFDAWIEAAKGKIDSLNSSQQMDMLRMQSLTNKRNEAFEMMTNFIKKMSDSRASIVGNMR